MTNDIFAILELTDQYQLQNYDKKLENMLVLFSTYSCSNGTHVSNVISVLFDPTTALCHADKLYSVRKRNRKFMPAISRR